jgi:hypothetical protein
MRAHVSHVGVHDHGFNKHQHLRKPSPVDARRQNRAKRLGTAFLRTGHKSSGAVQANRWSKTRDGGFIYSFNGPHSLFVDTIRSCRALMVSHQLGHYLPGETTFIFRCSSGQSVICWPQPNTRFFMAKAATATMFGAHCARIGFQPERRELSLSQFATGLHRLFNLDTGSGLGHARFCRRTGVSGNTS